MATRLPAPPWGDGALELFEFLQRYQAEPEYRAQCDALVAKIRESYAEHMAAVELVGKAEEISELHESAKAWQERAIKDYAARKANVEDGEAALKQAKADHQKQMAQDRHKFNAEMTTRTAEVEKRETVVTEREDACGRLEEKRRKAIAAAEAREREAQGEIQKYRRKIAAIEAAQNA